MFEIIYITNHYEGFLHSFEANQSILKFAIGNRKLLTLPFSVAILNRRYQISLLLFSVHVKDIWDGRMWDGESQGFQIQFQILFMNRT